MTNSNRVFTGPVRKSWDVGITIDTRLGRYRGTLSSTGMFRHLGSAAIRRNHCRRCLRQSHSEREIGDRLATTGANRSGKCRL